MSSGRLLVRFSALMAYRGMILGLIAALIGYLMIFFVFISIYIIFALMYGVIVGMLIGGICGLICGIVTLTFFRETKDDRAYISTMMTTSGIVAFLLGVVIVGATHSVYAVVEIPLLNSFGLLGGILAAGGAIYAGREIGKWYVRTEKDIKPIKES